MSHEAREAKTRVECFKEEEEGVEERRGFCLVEWFMEKKMLVWPVVVIYLFIYLLLLLLLLLLYNFFNKSCKPSYVYNIKHAIFQYYHKRKFKRKIKDSAMTKYIRP